MYWLYLPLALACFIQAFRTTSMGVLALCLLGALLLLMAWVRGLYVARFQGLESDDRAFLEAHRRSVTPPAAAPREPAPPVVTPATAPPHPTEPPLSP